MRTRYVGSRISRIPGSSRGYTSWISLHCCSPNIWLAVKVHKIVFDRAITTRDLQEQLAVSVGLNRLANVILKAKGDTIITISPTMLGNNSRLESPVKNYFFY